MDAISWGAAFGLFAEFLLRPAAIVLESAIVFWLWPVVVLGVIAGLAPLRTRVRQSLAPADLRAAIFTSIALMIAVGVVWLSHLRVNPAPKASGDYYQDLLFNLSLTRTLQVDVFPQSLQAVGAELAYHWFANSHIASVGMGTGVDPARVIFQLWFVPVLIVSAFGLCGLARQCSSVWWTGPLTVWLALSVTSTLSLDAHFPLIVKTVVVPLSPSQMFLLPLMITSVSLIVDIFRSVGGLVSWAGVVPLAVMMAGTKPSGLPMIAGGASFVLMVQFLRTRRVDRSALGLLSIATVLFIGAHGVLTRGSDGSGFRLFGWFRSLLVYRVMSGDTSLPRTGGLWVPGLETWAGVGACLSILAALVAMHALKLLGAGAMLVPSMRRDRSVQMLAGASLTMWIPFLVVEHPGYSQHYFLYTLTPVSLTLTAWLLAALTPASRSGVDVAGRAIVIGVGAGSLVILLAAAVRPDPSYAWLAQVAGVAVVAGLATLVSLIMRARSGERHSRNRVAVVAVGAALVGMTLPSGVLMVNRLGYPAHFFDPVEGSVGPRFISAGRIEAAKWLDEHAVASDVVLTNAHCMPAHRTNPCDARAFWLSALSGQPVLLEGWAYTSENLSEPAPPSLSKDYRNLSSPWPWRFQVSQQTVSDPRLRQLRRLYDRGVRWIVADKGVSDVSNRLRHLAHLEYDNEDVEIYRIPSA